MRADGVEVRYFAVNPSRAETLLRERFGDTIRPCHEGAGLNTFPVTVATWSHAWLTKPTTRSPLH